MNKFTYILCAVPSGMMALIFLSMSGDFWAQLPTFFWKSVPVTITASEMGLNARADGADGRVTFRYTADSVEHSAKDSVVERYSWGNVKQKGIDCAAAYQPGKTVIAYLSPDHSRISLGHFPRFYGPSNTIIGALALFTSVLNVLQAWKKHRAEANAIPCPS